MDSWLVIGTVSGVLNGWNKWTGSNTQETTGYFDSPGSLRCSANICRLLGKRLHQCPDLKVLSYCAANLTLSLCYSPWRSSARMRRLAACITAVSTLSRRSRLRYSRTASGCAAFHRSGKPGGLEHPLPGSKASVAVQSKIREARRADTLDGKKLGGCPEQMMRGWITGEPTSASRWAPLIAPLRRSCTLTNR